jgi:nucleoside-diphosphate-sugar epimerase
MRILLTGANSFIGRHLSRHLRADGFEVVATHRTEARGGCDEQPGWRTAALDVGVAGDFLRLPEAIDAIVHVAGVSAAAGVTPAEMLKCNVDGARNVLDYARRAGARRIVYASTLSVHGDVETDEVTERTPVRDPGLYGASKLVAERLFAEAANEVPAAAIRLPGVLGRGAHRAWIPTLLDSIRAGRPIAAFNPEAPFNNAAHVGDLSALVAGMLRGQWLGFHAFPIGAAGRLKIRDVIGLLLSASGRDVPVRFQRDRRRSFTISSRYAREAFGYEPREIGAMIEDYVRESS